MESPLDVDTTGEIRRHLATAQAALAHLEALLAPAPAGNSTTGNAGDNTAGPANARDSALGGEQ